jgi:zinc transport system substrate-binding protein
MLKKYLLLFIFAFGCGKTALPTASKPLVLTSIAPYRFLAEKIAGDRLEVQTIVPTGANPHIFEPTSSETAQMARGEIWLQIGEPFEEKIGPILKARKPDLVLFDLRTGIPLLEEAHSSCHHCSKDQFDRHIWLSPKLAALQAKEIERIFSEKYPEFAPEFKANLASLLNELSHLDREIKARLEPVQNRSILVSHPAFGYFCKDYHLEQLSVEFEGKDPRPKHLEEILKKARAQNIGLALSLPQHNNKGAELIAQKLSKPIYSIDPYSADYFGTLQELARLIGETHE